MTTRSVKFGVRSRLVLLITALLAGTSATQFYLNWRQQQEVLARLVRLNHEINQTVRDIDRQIQQRASRLSAPMRASDSLPEEAAPGSVEQAAVRRELESFIQFVNSNFSRMLSGQDLERAMLEHVARLRRLADSEQPAPEGWSFFSVTLSVMDEMSRKSPRWHYEISSNPAVQTPDNILQVSIPVIEEGQVRFVHMQYEISDFLEQFHHFQVTSLLVTLSVLGVGLTIAILFAGYFTRPIRRLSDSFNRVEQGDLDCRIEVGRRDEIGQLVDGFNRMVERLKQNKDLEKTVFRQERLSSLGELAAGIAHEIKNPLNAIRLTLQHMGDKLKLESEGDRALWERYSPNIQREVTRLTKIVDTFLNFSRMNELERSPVDLNALVEEVLTLLARDAAGRGVRVETDYAGRTLVKNVDPEKIKTVLLNLVINAIQAMPSGGRLTVRTVGGPGAPARISVADTGCGIAPENLERIFDLFYSSKENGSGLGLPIVNNIVRDHGGEIKVKSSLGTGSEFTVTLP
ncbi:HAMP domain-containing protein [bacterium]|nr:HAMP domain-containing protein [bacterium]